MLCNCCILATVTSGKALSWPGLAIMLAKDAARRAIFAAYRAWQGEHDMTQSTAKLRAAALLVAGAAGLLAAGAATPVSAQEAAQEPDYLAALKACRAIKDEADRLKCEDAKVGAMVSASGAT